MTDKTELEYLLMFALVMGLFDYDLFRFLWDALQEEF